MSYLVLARKYRPQKLDELVGQDHVATTLKNAISSGRVTHAFLFTGPRGVGKTSTARILAKSLNCKDGPTFDPCQKCESCKEINGGVSLDVIEIDGASNRKIDDIRALRENVKFVPVHGRYKIYIIDEVHQITHDAFNALLKTLEEPPGHVIFIFATTQAEKIPLTILSRCQRFDFRRIRPGEMIPLLKKICSKEKVDIDDAALFSIAKISDGSMRDAESLLDQLISFLSEKITNEDVGRLLGLVSRDNYFRMADAVLDKNAGVALSLIRSVDDLGGDMVRFFTDLVLFFRDILVFREVGQARAMKNIDLMPEMIEKIAPYTERFTSHELLYIIHLLSEAIEKMKRSPLANIPAEVAAMRLTSMPRSASIDELLQKLGAAGSNSLVRNAPMVSAKSSLHEAPESKVPTPAKADPGHVEHTDSFQELWQRLLTQVKEKSITVGLNLCKSKKVSLQDDKLVVGYQKRDMFHKEIVNKIDSKELIEKVAQEVLGKKVLLELVDINGEGGQNEKAGLKVLPNSKKEILNDPNVKGIISAFDGEVINIER